MCTHGRLEENNNGRRLNPRKWRHKKKEKAEERFSLFLALGRKVK